MTNPSAEGVNPSAAAAETSESETSENIDEMKERKEKWTCCDPRQTDFFKIEKPLIKYKSFFFFFHGAIGSVCSYFSIYYKQLGFSPNQIGVISGMRPFVGFWSGPIWGLVADRFRIKRIMLLISAISWLAFITSIGFVSPANLDPDCAYVSAVKKNFSGDVTEAKITKELSDRTSEERLQESRSWMFDQEDLNRVFTTIIILVVLGEVVQSPTGALADSGCVEELGTNNIHKYGHQRAWGSLSPGIT